MSDPRSSDPDEREKDLDHAPAADADAEFPPEPETTTREEHSAQDEAEEQDGPGQQDAATSESVVVPDELVEIVREAGGDPEKVRPHLTFLAMEMEVSQWRGPLPHPDALARYNNAYPGCARDIVEMAQSQARHRQSLEMTVVEADSRLRHRGQNFGFVIAMTVIVGGFALIGIDKSVAGFGAVLVGLASLVGLFLYSRRRQSQELAAKREALERSVSDENGE